jgi:immunity protein 50 of polymorphic toxin system
MTNIEACIEGSDKLTRIFGCWPSFHDAEVIELKLRRDAVNFEEKAQLSPVLTVKVHLWDMTSEVDSKGFFVLRNHTMATLRFHAVEDFKMEGFNQQNVIFGLEITDGQASQDTAPAFSVSFDASFGLDATFKCAHVEVVDAVPCDSKGSGR